MWPLLMFSVITTALVLERCWFWSGLWFRQPKVIRQVLTAYATNPEVALKKLHQHQTLPLARVFLAALSVPDATPEEFELALMSSVQMELPLLKRFQTLFETVIGIAPLLGLLGTILGLIRALSSLTLGDAGAEAVGVTTGIGEALVSTAAGLILAIATLVFANLFQGLYRRQRIFMEAVGSELELLYRRHYRQGTSSIQDAFSASNPPPHPKP